MKRSQEQTQAIKIPQALRTFESSGIGNFDIGNQVILVLDNPLYIEYPDPDRMWIKKPTTPSPDAENFKSALHDLIPPLENLTDEDAERMTYDDTDILDDE